ncbi:MAG: hypothetical protein ABSB73_07535, partial [Solirubrobacteraceae bacterium]
MAVVTRVERQQLTRTGRVDAGDRVGASLDDRVAAGVDREVRILRLFDLVGQRVGRAVDVAPVVAQQHTDRRVAVLRARDDEDVRDRVAAVG